MLSVSKPLALYDLTCRTCSKMRLEQSANRHVFSWKQWLSHCGEKHPMSWGRKIRVLEPILLHREVISQRLRSQDLLGLHRQKNTQPLGRHDPSGITFSKYAGPDPQIKRVKNKLYHTQNIKKKFQNEPNEHEKIIVGKWSRLPSLGDDFWFVLLQTKIAHLGSASNICALRLENLEKHISPMAKEWQTKLEGWKVKTTPTHTVFFYLQHDAVKHGWTMSLDYITRWLHSMLPIIPLQKKAPQNESIQYIHRGFLVSTGSQVKTWYHMNAHPSHPAWYGPVGIDPSVVKCGIHRYFPIKPWMPIHREKPK